MIFNIDLSRKLLLPYELTLQIIQQYAKEHFDTLLNIAFSSELQTNNANDWINIEALGNLSANQAQKVVTAFFQKCPDLVDKSLTLTISLGQNALNIDTIYELLFYAEKLSVFNVTLVSTQTLELDALASCSNVNVKTISNASIASAISFENRLQLLGKMGFHFLHHETDEFAAKDVLNTVVGYAWTLLKCGSYDISCTILEDLLSRASVNDHEKAQALMHLQLIRYHSHQYVKVAEQAYDYLPFLDQRSAQYLHYIKAYAATMSRKTEIAGESFTACHVQQDMEIEDEFALFQLNIFALYHVLIQKPDVAYQLEMRIENAIQTSVQASLGLRYVNNINIARLYKFRKEYDRALQYYQQAYDQISGGGYTTSDYIYYHMNLAHLFETQQERTTALKHWLRAAMHWLASDNPYSLAWRPKIILCAENTTLLNKPLSIQTVNDFFVDKIKTLLQSLNIKLQKSPSYHFQLNKSALHHAHAIVQDDWVFYTQSKYEKRQHPQQAPLQALVSQYLCTEFHINDHHQAVVIDYVSESLLQHTHEYLPCALIHECEQWYVNHEMISSSSMNELLSKKAFKVVLSPLIQQVEHDKDGIKLTFERQFMNCTIHDPEQIHLIQQLREKSLIDVQQIKFSEAVIQLLYLQAITFKVH